MLRHKLSKYGFEGNEVGVISMVCLVAVVLHMQGQFQARGVAVTNAALPPGAVPTVSDKGNVKQMLTS